MTAPLLAVHTGRRCKPKPPPWYQRAAARVRSARQRRQAEAARDDAYAGVLREINADRHAPAPRPAAAVVAAGPAPAAVLPDVADGRWPHLAPAWDDDTRAFGLSIVEAGQ